MNANEITIENTAAGVTLSFCGPRAKTEIFDLFGSYTIPAPFTHLNPDTASEYVKLVRRNWPGWVVAFV